MKQLKMFVVMVIVAFTAFSCANNNKSAKSDVIDEHSAKISLDWQGTYSGMLPCADCQGIETELTLNDDNTYMLVSTYMGVEPVVSDTLTGKFHWHGNNVHLEGIPENERSSTFKVEENRVKHLDLEGNEIIGDLASYYVLAKEGNQLVEDRKWKLVEIYGKPVEDDPDSYYIVFHSADRRVEAKANCNLISVNYRIKNEFRVIFGQGLTTLMACPDQNLEKELLNVLGEADNLSTDGEYLSLNKARMAPLARFELVK